MANSGSSNKSGKVYWITGLSGAGKTTVGKKLYEHLLLAGGNAVHLDGDELRKVFGGEYGYSKQERVALAMNYARLCELLSRQGLDVVCTTISMFQQVQKWNRENISCYCQIYLRVPLAVLKKRDQKGIYSAFDEGSLCDVSGIDLDVEEPWCSDLTVVNDGALTTNQVFEEIRQAIM